MPGDYDSESYNGSDNADDDINMERLNEVPHGEKSNPLIGLTGFVLLAPAFLSHIIFEPG